MNNRHLFILPRGCYRGANADEVRATIDGLREMGLYRLPYDDDVYIQLPASDCLVSGDKRPTTPYAHVIVGPLGNRAEHHPRVLAFNTLSKFEIDLSATPKTDAEQVAGMVECASSVLIAMLATRNVVKVTKENKLAKFGIGKKNPAKRFAYTTTISYPTEMDDHESVAPGAAKCPHLRRGHIRRQHYGPGREYIKKVWIDPVFVNADPDFVDQRRAYNISPTKETSSCP